MDKGHSQAPRKDILPESKPPDRNMEQNPAYSGPNRCSTSDAGAENKSRDEK